MKDDLQTQDRKTQSIVILLVIILVLAATIWAGWNALERYVTASNSYEVNAEFEVLPRDDKGLEEWLRKRPGVVKVFIQRDWKAVNVIWIMVQNMRGEPPVPDLRTAFQECGYRGITKYEPR